jgi:O-antigen/teichoic acid export membrane protein
MTLVDVLQALHRSVSVSVITFISGLVLTLAAVIIAFLGGGPLAIAASYCFGPATLLALTLRRVKQIYPIRIRFSLGTMKQLLVRSRGFTAQQILNSVPVHAEAFLLPQIVGFTRFGFYSAGTLLPSRLGVLPDAVCTATYPLLCQQFKMDRDQGIRNSTYLSLIVTAGAFAMALVGALCSGLIARVLFPAHPELCQFVLLVTIWTLPLSALDACIGYAMNAAGADEAQARASLPAAACNVLLIVLLMTQMGVAGACIAMPLRHFVRIIMLGICCLHLRRAGAFAMPLTFPAAAT